MDEDGWIKKDYLNTWNQYLPNSVKADTIEDILNDLFDDNWKESKPKGKSMRKCNVSMPDASDKIVIDRGCIFIAPTTTGFMLYTNPEGTIEIHCCSDIDDVLTFLENNKLLDQTQIMIAENI